MSATRIPAHRRILATMGIAATAAVAVAGSSLPAQAAPGDTTNICASSLTPSGWVDIAHYYTSSCGTASFNKNAKTTYVVKAGTVCLASQTPTPSAPLGG